MTFGNNIPTAATEDQLIKMTMSLLAGIYSNKSSDEYKSHGDITISAEYHEIEKMIAELKDIIGLPKNEANNLTTLFNTLHRPVFKTMVVAYIASPNEENTIYTASYTVGFRVLIGELSRIYASTVATTKGIKYNPDKVQKQNNIDKLIAYLNNDLEKKINDNIKRNKTTTDVQEAFDITINLGKIYKNIKSFAKSVSSFNITSIINTLLMSKYDRKVSMLNDACREYDALNQAYQDYMKKPEALRNNKVEKSYIKNIEKYNIRMQDLKAKLAHYNSRDEEAVKDELKKPTDDKTPDTSSTSTDETTDNDNSNNDFDF